MGSIQILHYEFMGPVPLDEWGPPMEEVVYVILGRRKEQFSLIYADHCTSSTDASFFTKNPGFECWVNNTRSEKSLYVAIYPMFDSQPYLRQRVVDKIISKYKPVCNVEHPPAMPPHSKEKTDTSLDCIRCACCGSDMKLERHLEKSNLYKCTSCGISDTRLK